MLTGTVAFPSPSLTVTSPMVTVGGPSLSIIVTVAVCVPNSDAHPPLTLVISTITVSGPSSILSSIGLIVTVPVVEPAGMVIILELGV